jgi:hypothetical protein
VPVQRGILVERGPMHMRALTIEHEGRARSRGYRIDTIRGLDVANFVPAAEVVRPPSNAGDNHNVKPGRALNAVVALCVAGWSGALAGQSRERRKAPNVAAGPAGSTGSTPRRSKPFCERVAANGESCSRCFRIER